MAHRLTPEMRSALLAGSYARWLRKHHPYPVVAPPLQEGVLPVSLSRARGMLDTAWQQGETGQCACRRVERVLSSCRHPERAQVFTPNLQEGFVRKFGRSPVNLVEEPPKPDSWFDTDIEFDRDTNVTTIHVCSIFVNVPEPKGEEFILFAEPALWAERAEFFRASTPGRWDSEREIFDVDDWWLRAMQEFKPSEAPLTTDLARQLVPAWRQYASEYFIFEHAEWEWSPEETGGIMNELKIGREEPPVDQFSEMLSAVYRKLAAEAKKTRRELEKENKARSHDSQRAEVNRLDLFEATQNQIALHQLMAEFPAENAHATHSIRFAYKLHRSLQSRFLSSWVRGGLSIDDGTYEAAWFPKDEQGGLLCIRADKKIHFTRRADVFEDYSKLLNLLAPSLASMLMEELAYQGVLEFLEEEGAAGFGRPTTPPVSRVLGSTRHSAAVG